MTSEEVIELLNSLSDYKARVIEILQEKISLIDGVMTPEIKTKIAEIEEEYNQKAEFAIGKIASLETEIKKAVIQNGATVKGNELQAVFSKGRISWDTSALNGYSVAHPELKQFCKEGEPTVSIRAINR